MKVCHLTSVHASSDTRIFVKECTSLVKAGFEVTLIAPGEKEEVRNGVKIIPVNKGSRLKRMIFTVNEVYRKALRADAVIYHFHDPELIRIAIRLKNKGKKVIYDVHEDLPRQLLVKHYLPRFSGRLFASWLERYENTAAKKFDQIITVTPLIESRFKRVNPHTSQICNFPSLKEFKEIETNWDERKNEICYVGNISEIRGIREMVKAVAHVDIRLHLAGNFSPPSLRNEISGLRGWSRVVEHGFLLREKVQQLLSYCKMGLVVLHPVENYVDGYPVKMFEYMAAGIPVIASDFPLWKEIVEMHHCGLCVDPMNVQAISEAIQYLLAHDEEAKQMGMNGRKAIISKYNWQQEEKKLISVYQNLINESALRR